jgi:hypothetical protein
MIWVVLVVLTMVVFIANGYRLKKLQETRGHQHNFHWTREAGTYICDGCEEARDF